MTGHGSQVESSLEGGKDGPQASTAVSSGSAQCSLTSL